MNFSDSAEYVLIAKLSLIVLFDDECGKRLAGEQIRAFKTADDIIGNVIMLHVKQIVNGIFASNTYIISEDDSNDYWLIDIGDLDKVLDCISREANIKGVFLTHSHFDHIYGMNELFCKFPQMVVYTSAYGVKALYSEKRNFSYYHESPIVFEGKSVKILKQGDSVLLFDKYTLEVYETPGHCPSSLTYVLDKYIFTGDSYIPGVEVFSKLPGGNKKLAAQSKERIIKLSENKIICAGHYKVGQE